MYDFLPRRFRVALQIHPVISRWKAAEFGQSAGVNRASR